MKFIGFLCASCDTLFKLDFDKESPHIVESIFRSKGTCPRCKEGLLSITGYDKKFSHKVDVTAEDLWKAIHGLGLPGEEAGVDSVEHILKTYKVDSFSILSSNRSERCIINSITFRKEDDVKTIHFAASGEGAAVFKVTTEEK